MNTTDILIGLPSLNEADSIGFVTKTIDCGLARFPSFSACLANIDSGSTDGTSNAFLSTPTTARKISLLNEAVPRGKGANLIILLKLAKEFGARYIATFDTDTRSIDPAWVPTLLNPVINGDSDFVLPLYTRNRFEGSTTNHFAFPLIYALWGETVRQPIGGEFAFNLPFVNYLLEQSIPDAAKAYGIDIFFTLNAIQGGFRINQKRLGKKLHKPSFPKIVPMFMQVASTAYSALASYRGAVKPLVTGDTENVGIDEIGSFPHKERAEVLDGEMNAKLERLNTVYKPLLSVSLYQFIFNEGGILDNVHWAQVLHEMLSNAASTSADNLAELLAPLFIRRAVWFWKESELRSALEVENEIFQTASLLRSLRQ